MIVHRTAKDYSDDGVRRWKETECVVNKMEVILNCAAAVRLFVRSFSLLHLLLLRFLFLRCILSWFLFRRHCSMSLRRILCIHSVCVSAAATTILQYERKRILENALQMARWHLCSRSHAHRTIERQSESHLLSSQHANALKWIMRLLFRCFVHFCVKLSLTRCHR